MDLGCGRRADREPLKTLSSPVASSVLRPSRKSFTVSKTSARLALDPVLPLEELQLGGIKSGPKVAHRVCNERGAPTGREASGRAPPERRCGNVSSGDQASNPSQPSWPAPRETDTPRAWPPVGFLWPREVCRLWAGAQSTGAFLPLVPSVACLTDDRLRTDFAREQQTCPGRSACPELFSGRA